MFRRAVGSLLARRFSPHATPRTAPARSFHSLKDLPVGDGIAAGVAAAALFAGGALAYFKKTPIGPIDDESAAREEEDMKARFEEWIKKFDKTYENEEEKAMRFQLFKGNVKWFDSLPPSHRKELQIGYFSDFKDEECPWSRSCVHIDDTEDEVVCQNKKGELFIWRRDVKQGETPATQVSA